MKRNSIIFLLLFTAFVAAAQNQVDELINKGNEAMNNLDYISAKMSYEEVVYSNCNMHTIGQLTIIWTLNDSLRTNMDLLMKKCLSCLEDKATNYRDTASMELLVTFYTEGIGTDKDEARAEIWKQRLEEIRNPNRVQFGQNAGRPPRDKVKMQFFAGYSANLLAPYGLMVGGVGRSVGWYLRFRTNLSFQDYTEECDDSGNIIGELNNGRSLPEPLGVKKTKMLIGTGGFVIKADPSFYISVGAGYCKREVFYQFESIGIVDSNPEGKFWAIHNGEKSTFSGVAFDLDGTFKIGKKMYGSAGFSLLDLKYLYANAGIGVFF